METRADSGLLFTNDRKQKPTHPDYQGKARITCPHCHMESDLRLAGWKKQGSRGPFVSLAISEPREPNAKTRDDDDRPF